MPPNSLRTRHRERPSRYSPSGSKNASRSTHASHESGPHPNLNPANDIDESPSRYDYRNFPPGQDVWRAEDIRAIALAVNSHNSTRPAFLLTPIQQNSDKSADSSRDDNKNDEQPLSDKGRDQDDVADQSHHKETLRHDSNAKHSDEVGERSSQDNKGSPDKNDGNPVDENESRLKGSSATENSELGKQDLEAKKSDKPETGETIRDDVADDRSKDEAKKSSGEIKEDKTGDKDRTDKEMVESSLPEPLTRKTVSDIREGIDHLHQVFSDDSEISSPPPCNVNNFLAVLASEMTFMDSHARERSVALCDLIKARRKTANAELFKQSVLNKRKTLSRQIAKERELNEAAAKKKEELDAEVKDCTKSVEQKIGMTNPLRDELYHAKINSLELRRRLDRLRLKVGAIHGEMTGPTVDEIVVNEAPPYPLSDEEESDEDSGDEDCDEEQAGIEGNVKAHNEEEISLKDNSKVRCKKRPRSLIEHNYSWRHPYMSDGTEPEVGIGTSRSELKSVKGSDKFSESEEMEYRLLKYRLMMMEQDVVDWRDAWEAERRRTQLIVSAKKQLADEVSKLHKNSASKLGPLSVGRSLQNGLKSISELGNKSADKMRPGVPSPVLGVADEAGPVNASRKRRKTMHPKRGLVSINK